MKKRILFLILPLSLVMILLLVSVSLRSSKDIYTFPFADSEIESVILYLSSESAENGKKVIEKDDDIVSLLSIIYKSTPGKRYDSDRRNSPAGGHTFYIEIADAENTFLCTYSQGSEFGSGHFSDGTHRITISNLDMLDFWYSLDYDVLPLTEAELMKFPALWENY